MMRWSSLLACVAIYLNGCDRPKPKLNADAMLAIRSEYPGMTDRCAEEIRFGRDEALNDTAQCFRMTEARQWRGLWLDGFEAQQFCPIPAQKCEVRDVREGQIWLRFPGGEKPTGRLATGKVYQIEFIGRRTLLPGAHGHMGTSEHEMLVERITALKAFGS